MNTLYLKIGGAKLEIICYYSNMSALISLMELKISQIGSNAALMTGKYLPEFILKHEH